MSGHRHQGTRCSVDGRNLLPNEEATAKPERRRRHHYIPRFLQKRFCDADGMLWYGIQETQVVRRVSHRHAFVEKELYTSYEEAHERLNDIAYEPDDRYEREFAELEGRAAPAIEKLIAGTRHLVREGSTDLLRRMLPREITACKQLLISVANRTPDAIRSAIARSRATSREAISKLDLRPLERFPAAVQAGYLRRLERSAAVHVASSSHRDVLGGFDPDSHGLAVATYTDPGDRFIIGSCGAANLPVVEDDLDGTWLPISPQDAIVLDKDPDTITHFKDWEGLCRRINEALARRSKLIAGDSKRLVELMLQPRSTA